MQQTSSVKVDW